MGLPRIQLGFMIAGVCAGGALAQDEPDFGFDFVTITDVGNRDTTLEETEGPFGYAGAHIGGVDYEYRIATTEVTVEQYFEFFVAYLPTFTKNGNRFPYPTYTGRYISVSGGHAEIDAGSADRSASMGWHFAARYVNWLHNGKVNQEWAFENGVYDTSTFTRNPDGTHNHQVAHHPGVRFWIPTRDEWTKASYWDPGKDSGKGGYWRYPNSSDIEPIPSLLPENGGERNAGPIEDGWPLDIASFPNVLSPWGLLDTAGGVTEHSETPISIETPQRRRSYGSSHVNTEYGRPWSNDILGKGDVLDTGIGSAFYGLRLAAAVPNLADLNRDGRVNYFDVTVFIQRYIAGDLSVDFDGDGELGLDDVLVFLELVGSA